jgi:hypothetical protein
MPMNGISTMKHPPLRRFSSLATAWVLPILWIGTASGGEPSFFRALDVTPEELVAAGQVLSIEAMSSLPASASERRALLDALLGLENKSPALQLLEIQGNRREALEMVDGGLAHGVDPVHHVRLLHREGNLKRAGDLFAQIQMTGHRRSNISDMPFTRVFAAVHPFMVKGEHDEMAGFLAWLQPHCTLSEWRSSVMARRLELALGSDRMLPLLIRLAMESSVSADIALHWLNPNQPMPGPKPGTSVADLAWWVSIQGCSDEIAPLLRVAIESGTGSEAERRELMRQMLDRRNADIPLDGLFLVWMKREAEFIRLLKEVDYSFIHSPRIPFNQLCAIAENHPRDVTLNLLAGLNQTRIGGNRAITQGAVDCLTRAWRVAPLAGLVRDKLSGRPEIITAEGRNRLPQWRTDPALSAIYELFDRIPPSRLYELIRAHPDFESLPVPDQHRYLLAAGLDAAALDLVSQMDWENPANDMFGGLFSVWDDFPDSGTPKRYFDIIPQVKLGSPEKPAEMVAAHSVMMLNMLWNNEAAMRQAGPRQREMVERWSKGIVARGPAYVDCVLAANRQHGGYRIRYEGIERYFGADAARRERLHDESTRMLRAKADAVSWFGSSRLHGFPFGYEPRWLGRPDMVLIAGQMWLGSDDFNNPPCAWLVPRYPALGNIIDSTDEAAPWAARIRELLGDADPLAAAYDIAILAGEIKAADERAMLRARSHMGARLDTGKEPDFVLVRASRGVSLRHAKPPEAPDAIRELWEIRESTMPYRIAAADLVSRGRDQEFRDRLYAATGTTGTQHRARSGLPPDPDSPIPPYIRSIYNSLKGMTTPDEQIQFLLNLPESHRISPYPLVVYSDLLEEFQPPHHLKLLDLMRMRFEPIRGLSGSDDAARYPDAVEIRRLHAHFLKLDPAAAASFRELAAERGWPHIKVVAEQLLEAGDRDAAVRWLARACAAPFDPPLRWAGHHRFPTRANPRDIYLMDQALPHDALGLVKTHGIAMDIASILEADPRTNFQVLAAFFRFFDAPGMETYEKHLGGLRDPDIPHFENTLRIRLSYLLARFPEHRELAAELRKSAEAAR